MPHIEVRPDANTMLKALNIHPDPSTIRNAVVDLTKILGWKGFTIVYESGELIVQNFFTIYLKYNF